MRSDKVGRSNAKALDAWLKEARRRLAEVESELKQHEESGGARFTADSLDLMQRRRTRFAAEVERAGQALAEASKEADAAHRRVLDE